VARQRDYRREYRRRVDSGLQRGLSRSQARGHPGVNQALSSARARSGGEPKMEEALRDVRSGTALTNAAHQAHTTPDRLRRYLGQWDLLEKRGRHWTVGVDRRPRRVPLFSDGRELVITVPGYPEAAQVGTYMSAVGRLAARNDATALRQFRGRSVSDVSGTKFEFETRPDELYRLLLAGPEPFEDVYRIVV
jgi:hypothetical protein